MHFTIVALVSFVFWSALDAVSDSVMRQLARGGVTRAEGFYLKGVVHHALVGLGALAVYVSEELEAVPQPARSYECLPPVSELAQLLPPVTLGYGLHDVADGLRRQQGSFLLHGVLLCSVYGLLCYLDVAHYTCRLLLMNISTVFLNLRRIDLGEHNNMLIDYAFAASFVALRLVLMPLWWVQFLWYGFETFESSSWGVCMNGGIVAVAGTAGIVMHGLNFYWGFLIVQKVLGTHRGTAAKAERKDRFRGDDGLGLDDAKLVA